MMGFDHAPMYDLAIQIMQENQKKCIIDLQKETFWSKPQKPSLQAILGNAYVFPHHLTLPKVRMWYFGSFLLSPISCSLDLHPQFALH